MEPNRFDLADDITSFGSYLAKVRDAAGLTQSDLAQKITLSAASLSRVESGEKELLLEDLEKVLTAIGSDQAKDLLEFVKQRWSELPRPNFNNPFREALWEAHTALLVIQEMRSDPDLKAVFLNQLDLYEAQLRDVSGKLLSPEFQIAFVGSIGVGKSTAICKLLNLIREISGKLTKQIVLETGAGGITLCEVVISQGPGYGIRVVPRGDDSLRSDVADFADYLIGTVRGEKDEAESSETDGTDSLGISREVTRAIRNMAGLTVRRTESDGKKGSVDPAKQLAVEIGDVQELCVKILTKMELPRRTRRDEWYPENSSISPMEWLQNLFSAINNGRHPDFSIPQKIEVIVPDPILDERDYSIRIIDTKGIDQTAERVDLESLFDDPKTLVVLCTHFNNAPQVELQTLLKRAKAAGTRDLLSKSMVLVLPRPDEALAAKHDDGTEVVEEIEGYAVKSEQIGLQLTQQGNVGVQVEFYNAREEDPANLAKILLTKIRDYRQQIADQIPLLTTAVTKLSENRENEQVRMVFERIMSDLRSWVVSHSTLQISAQSVEDPLISAIDGTRAASTVRASVRRHGDWYNLDYHHQIGFGLRQVAVKQLGGEVGGLNSIIANLVANQDLVEGREFLESLQVTITDFMDQIYRRLQTAGHQASSLELPKASNFWSLCNARWGQGSGYRSAISIMTDQDMKTAKANFRSLLTNLLVAEWSAFILMLNNLLTEIQPGKTP